MATIDNQILSVCSNISSNIDNLSHNRGLLAQNLLSQIRNLIESVAVRLHLGNGSAEFHYNQTKTALEWVGAGKKQINFLHRFHRLIQMSASHYTLESDASERLMLKYFEYLLRIRTLLAAQCDLKVLTNLDKFPVDLDVSLREYHLKIAKRIEEVQALPMHKGRRSRYYIYKVRPFFSQGQIFYEVTFANAVNKISKFDRMIAFTKIDMTDNYAANLTLVVDSIDVLGHTMPIMIITDWEVSIRPCEIDNFAKIFGITISTSSSGSEYKAIMEFLTKTEGTLLNIIDMDEDRYVQIRSRLIQHAKTPTIFPVIDAARRISKSKSPGVNIIRYLMLRMNNQIIKQQYWRQECKLLSGLYLSFGCKPFDDMPFCSSAIHHNPRIADLMESLDARDRLHELMARRIRNNVERHGLLYTPVSDVEHFGDVEKLAAQYNSKLYWKHGHRKLLIDKGHVFLAEYEDGTVDIITKLQEYARTGLAGYEQAVEMWLSGTHLSIDDEAKKIALKKLFAKSSVALIFGAAGTGKSTMVNYIANYFGDRTKLFLAQTNPAIDNLKRKVSSQNTEFRTIASQNYRTNAQPHYDVLIIDECSTVSNTEFLKVLRNTKFSLLVLVGDVHQIESIQFGNWFNIIRYFLPNESVFELTKPFRTDNPALLEFWTKVRHLDEGIEELIASKGYSVILDQSLFRAERDDEIILCLNYDGLYGINNVNRFLQSGNQGKEITWDVTTYKVGDPVLFNDTDRFKPLIYNNLKGRIVDIVRFPGHAQFDVELDRPVTSLDVYGLDLRYVRGSVVSFDVFNSKGTDDDDDSINTSVPFQVAYAVSIHKAQGLEYDSVKVVITEANDEDISHNIFYTAITRTREHLRIFWTPETQRAVLESLERKKSDKDVALLRSRRGVK